MDVPMKKGNFSGKNEKSCPDIDLSFDFILWNRNIKIQKRTPAAVLISFIKRHLCRINDSFMFGEVRTIYSKHIARVAEVLKLNLSIESDSKGSLSRLTLNSDS